MWVYQKSLQYPVKIKNPNPNYAQIIVSQLGGLDGICLLFKCIEMIYKTGTGIPGAGFVYLSLSL